MRITLYKEEHQERILALAAAYGFQTLSKTLEHLIDDAYEQLQASQFGGSDDRNGRRHQAA